MSRAGKRLVTAAHEIHAITALAMDLFAQDGNPPEDWPVVDEFVRAQFLIAASRAIRETPAHASPASLQ